MLELLIPTDFRKTQFIALLGIFTLLTVIATTVFIIPFPTNHGYFNLGDICVMISGFLLGPLGGLFAGGVGSIFSEVILGFPSYVPITFIAKGSEGFLVGLFSSKTPRKDRCSRWDLTGLILGSFAMLIGYLLGEILLLGYEYRLAIGELITTNSIQIILGSIFTIIAGPLLRVHLEQWKRKPDKHKDAAYLEWYKGTPIY
jgi:uncharacterized membrane protein